MNDFNLRKFLVENKLTPQSLLNEPEDDEYNIDASPEWNARELTVGSKISVDDFKPETISSFKTWAKYLRNQPPYKDVIDNGLTISRIYHEGKTFYVHVNGTNKYITYFFSELDPNKAYIAPESITESNEDEFNDPIEASPEWNAQELTIGSRVTPDMWNKEAYDYFSKRDPKWVIRPEVNVVIYEIEKDGYGDIWIKLLWKPKKENKTNFPYRTNFINTKWLDPTKAYIAPQN